MSRFGWFAGGEITTAQPMLEFDREAPTLFAAGRIHGPSLLSLAFFDSNIAWSKLIGKHGASAGAKREP